MKFHRLRCQRGLKLTILKTLALGALIAMGATYLPGLLAAGAHDDEINQWTGSRNYAIFYPWLAGDDEEQINAGSDDISATVAEYIYPELDRRGGIYVDAADLDSTSEHPVLPYPAMSVNTNYLEEFPILDAEGHRIEVSEQESDWVIVVPETLRDREEEIVSYKQAERNGDDSLVESVVTYEQSEGRQVPESVRDQKVRIIWSKPGQNLFTFNTEIRPDAGNALPDPIVTIMTPNNSVNFDWQNTITGDPNTAMKVRVDGNPEKVNREIQPLLAEHELDDNFPHLVYPTDAATEDIALSAEDSRWLMTALIIVGGIALALTVTSVILISNRYRVAAAVRRLHGHTMRASYREIVAFMKWSWLGLIPGALMFATAIVVLNRYTPVPRFVDPFSILASWPTLFAVTGAIMCFEAVATGLALLLLDRQHPAQRLKEA